MKKKIVVVALISGVLGSSYAQDWDNYGTMNRERHGVSGRFSSDDGGRAFSQFRTAQQEPSAVQSREYQQSAPQYREPQYRDVSTSPEYKEPQYQDFSRPVAYQEPAYRGQPSASPYREQPASQYAEQSRAQYREQDNAQYAEQGGTQYRDPSASSYQDRNFSSRYYDESAYDDSAYRDSFAGSSAVPTQYSRGQADYRQGFDEGNFVMNDQTGERVVLGQSGSYAATPQTGQSARFAGDDSEWNRTPFKSSAALPHEDRRISRSASFDDNFGGGAESGQMVEQPLRYESQRQAMPQRRENVNENQASYRKKPLIGNPFRSITRTVGRLFGR